jgi:plasmid stabilization system protein ParE
LPRVELTVPFRDDVRRQVGFLIENEEWDRIEFLGEDLEIARRRLTMFPELGRELLADEDHTIRQMLLAQVPYLIWYRFHRRTNVVRLVRLFHAHQRTPQPRMWPQV